MVQTTVANLPLVIETGGERQRHPGQHKHPPEGRLLLGLAVADRIAHRDGSDDGEGSAQHHRGDVGRREVLSHGVVRAEQVGDAKDVPAKEESPREGESSVKVRLGYFDGGFLRLELLVRLAQRCRNPLVGSRTLLVPRAVHVPHSRDEHHDTDEREKALVSETDYNVGSDLIVAGEGRDREGGQNKQSDTVGVLHTCRLCKALHVHQTHM
eukprot:2102920-Pyramimonas_sp.AAC.1